jgi:hypothetical protein
MTVPPAKKYGGLTTSGDFERAFETQKGVPVDGSNKSLRRVSPFTFRVVLPPVLTVGGSASSGSVDLIGAAMSEYENSAQNSGTFDGIEDSEALSVLDSFLTNAQFRQNMGLDTLEPAIADTMMAVDVKRQIENIRNTPPLTLFINPESFSIQYAKVQTDTDRSRYDYIFQAWGEEQVSLSIGGKFGGFIAGEGSASGLSAKARNETSTPTGYQFASKRNSASWQQLMSLLTFFQNNGYIYDTLNNVKAPIFVGAVAIDYDQWTYVGHIESFSYGYEETNLHGNVDFSMEFKVSSMYDNSSSTSGFTTPSRMSNPNRGRNPDRLRRGPIPTGSEGVTLTGNTFRTAFQTDGDD